uniref:OmpA family protein n=1 Tax=Nitrospira cf. moscoviensis SBR1015 TaxID=96242 RepID=UPI000A36A398|nr:OmpA family protein [Nitrospira cf. moscoviensis SBR1015]
MPRDGEGEDIMRTRNTAMALAGLVVLVGCSSSATHSGSYIKQPNVCIDKKWYGYHQGSGCPSTAKAVASDSTAERLAALDRERQRLADELEAARRHNGVLRSRVSEVEQQLADREREMAHLRSGAGDHETVSSRLQDERDRLASELAAAKLHMDEHDRLAAESEAQLAVLRQRTADLEAQRADRERELAGLRGDLSAEMAKLKQAERGLIRALKPQINQKNITVDLNNERLLINLASAYLFGSGEDQLKPAGAEALKQVGAVLKNFPEYQVHVEGHTDNRPILGALKKKFPSNKELSEARAANAAQALADGGFSGAHATGLAETKPVMSNATSEGRAKNRRVEISVTK